MKQTYISLLRGINVGGHNKILMKDLTEMFIKTGFEGVKTYIQSGNIIFKYDSKETSELEQTIHEAISKTFQLDVPVIIRTSEQFEALANQNPFMNNDPDPKSLHLALLQREPEKRLVDALSTYQIGNDQFKLIGQDIYLFCPDGFGKTKLSNTFWDQKLKTISTIRNWKTIQELNALAKI